jgi:hypothetical protein
MPGPVPSRVSTALLLGSVLYLVAPASTLVQQAALPPGLARSSDPFAVEQRNNSAIGVILGEFRTNLSDLIFIKTERYLDSGVAYAPHINTAELAKSGETVQTGHESHAGEHHHGETDHHDHAGDDHHTSETDSPTSAGAHAAEHADEITSLEKQLATPAMREHAQLKPGQVATEEPEESVPTIIKTADKDFRGFIGNLERNVKPWRDPKEGHKHTAGTELLPWYRLATYSNPNNVRMYMIGAWWLKTLKTEQQAREALKFVEEGISHNPGAFQLYVMRGFIQRQLKQEDLAAESFKKATELGLKTRPADYPTSSTTWSDDQEEQLQSSMVMEILHARDHVSTQSAYELADKYARKLTPPNTVLRLRKQLAQDLQTTK